MFLHQKTNCQTNPWLFPKLFDIESLFHSFMHRLFSLLSNSFYYTFKSSSFCIRFPNYYITDISGNIFNWLLYPKYQRRTMKKMSHKKFYNIHRKTPLLHSLFNKNYWTLLERESNAGVFLWICEIFKNIYFEKHLQWAAFA